MCHYIPTSCLRIFTVLHLHRTVLYLHFSKLYLLWLLKTAKSKLKQLGPALSAVRARLQRGRKQMNANKNTVAFVDRMAKRLNEGPRARRAADIASGPKSPLQRRPTAEPSGVLQCGCRVW
jgi:hypothetical protein